MGFSGTLTIIIFSKQPKFRPVYWQLSFVILGLSYSFYIVLEVKTLQLVCRFGCSVLDKERRVESCVTATIHLYGQTGEEGPVRPADNK